VAEAFLKWSGKVFGRKQRVKRATKFFTNFYYIYGHDVINAWMYACTDRPMGPRPFVFTGLAL
jgi:hypothetical protein